MRVNQVKNQNTAFGSAKINLKQVKKSQDFLSIFELGSELDKVLQKAGKEINLYVDFFKKDNKGICQITATPLSWLGNNSFSRSLFQERYQAFGAAVDITNLSLESLSTWIVSAAEASLKMIKSIQSINKRF